MTAYIQIKLFATLKKKTPRAADRYPIEPGATVGELLAVLGVPAGHARLIFVDGVRKGTDTVLRGGERVGVFPPIGGG